MSILTAVLLALGALVISFPLRRLIGAVRLQHRSSSQDGRNKPFRWKPDTDPEKLQAHRKALRADYTLFRPGKSDYAVPPADEPPASPSPDHRRASSKSGRRMKPGTRKGPSKKGP